MGGVLQAFTHWFWRKECVPTWGCRTNYAGSGPWKVRLLYKMAPKEITEEAELYSYVNGFSEVSEGCKVKRLRISRSISIE